MKSRLFHSKDYLAVQDQVRDLINSSPDFLSKTTAQSPRAAGDAIENVVAASFDKMGLPDDRSARMGSDPNSQLEVTVHPGYSRKRWMLEFCNVMLEFYPKEIAKIGERASRFEQVREFWSKKADD